MKPYQKVKRQIESLYLEISKMQRGEICIYPDLARDLDKIKVDVLKLFDKSLTLNPDIFE